MGSFFSAALLAASLDIEVQQPVSEQKEQEIIAWVNATAASVALVYGRFPNPDVKITVIPSTENARGGNSPVIFGRVTRRGGERIELFVNPDYPIEDFYGDWTATHEFSHLMLPLLSQRYRWISEGFASYYQNMLMARAGQYTPELAWQRLMEGFSRGRESRPELSLNDAAEGRTRNARMKIYWSGAAIALLADIELRTRSNGEESLDSVLGQLQQCCLPSRRRWSGPMLFEKLDSFVDTPVFMPLYRKHANNEGFPEFEGLFDELGVSFADDRVIFDDSATQASHRRALTQSSRHSDSEGEDQ